MRLVCVLGLLMLGGCKASVDVEPERRLFPNTRSTAYYSGKQAARLELSALANPYVGNSMATNEAEEWLLGFMDEFAVRKYK